MKTGKAYFRGCLLGGAIGDAMGYPVEEMNWEEIQKIYGEHGVTDLTINTEKEEAMFSDDTQMSIFTVDGLLWADKRAKERGIYGYIPCLFYSYQKWLYTQTGHFADDDYDFLLGGEILTHEELFARRLPAVTNLNTLSGCINGKYGTLKNRINQSRAADAVMRTAPIGLYFCNDPKMAFRTGVECGAITHGHADAILPAGFLACLVAYVIQGKELEKAVLMSMEELRTYPGHEATENALEKAMDLAGTQNDELGSSEREAANRIDVSAIGRANTGEEALALAIYCAMRYPYDFEKAICLAVNHGGNSDTAASVCGSILGAYLGTEEIPYPWIKKIESSVLLVHGADKILEATT